MGRERYQDIPRTVIWAVCVFIVFGLFASGLKRLYDEQIRRKALLAHCIEYRQKLLNLSRERAVLIGDLTGIAVDLESLANAEEAEGHAAEAATYRRQATEKRDRIRVTTRYQELLGRLTTYYSSMIETYRRGVRLPLTRLGPDRLPPDVSPEVYEPVEDDGSLYQLLNPLHSGMAGR